MSGGTARRKRDLQTPVAWLLPSAAAAAEEMVRGNAHCYYVSDRPCSVLNFRMDAVLCTHV